MIQDITPATDNWSKGYAHLEYLRIGLLNTFAHSIPVLDQNGCRLINGCVIHDDYCSCGTGEDER